METDFPEYSFAKDVDFSEIPVVDLTGIQTSVGRSQIGAKIVEAAENVGFFYIRNHGIGTELMFQAFAISKAFFGLSQDDKASIAVDQRQRGWMAQGMA